MALERKTPLRRSGKRIPARSARRVERGEVLDVPDATRRAVFHRAGYTCEVRFDGCLGAAGLAPHHRWARGNGNHEPENLVAVCPNCHTASPEAIHRNVERSETQGLILRGPPSEPWSRKSLGED